MATDIIARGMAGNVGNLLKDIIIESGVEGIVKVSFEKHPNIPGQYYLVTEDIWKTKTKKLIPKDIMARFDDKGNVITKTYVADIQFKDGKLQFYSFEEDLIKEIDLSKATTYTNSKPTTAPLGGIPKGATFENATLEQVLTDLLYPYVPFSFGSISFKPDSGGTFEYGTSKTLSSIVPTFTEGSHSISKLTIKNGTTTLLETTDVVSGKAINLPSSIKLDGTTDLTITATMTDGKTTTSKSASYVFTKYIYYGISNSTTAPTNVTKTKYKCTDTMSNDTSITVGNGQYIWFFTTESGVKLQQYSLGQWNNMSTTSAGKVTLTVDSGEKVSYNAFRSDKMSASTGIYRILK